VKQVAPIHPDEEKRLLRLRKLMVLDSPPETLFDEIVKLASEICAVPIALISLIDENRQWFKANIGLSDVLETPRDIAFCAHTILQNDIYEIPDASQDAKFKNNPLVTEIPNIRFYAGAPISMPGAECVGTLCVIDNHPKHLTESQKHMLVQLAKIVSAALLQREKTIHEIQTKSNKLAAIIESSVDAVISKSLDGIVVSWNHGAEQLFGYSAQEMIGQPITRLFPEDRLEEAAQFLQQLKNNQYIKQYETERLNKSGEVIKISVSLSPVRNANGEVVGISKIARDITAQQKVISALAEEHERLKVTMASIGDAVITTDQNGLVEYLNPVAELLTGWSSSEAHGLPLQHVFKIVNESTAEPCRNPVEICLKENRTVGLDTHAILVSRDGSYYGIEDSAAPIRDAHGKTLGAVLVFHDVTAQRKMVNEMTYRATHDELTGIFNRTEFEHMLDVVLNNSRDENQEHALMYIDLDQFKVINETAGHYAGDLLLREVVDVIEKCMRTSDTLARLGGDEFGIILQSCGAEPAMRISQQICQRLDKYRFNHENKRYRIGASIGLVIIDSHWDSITSILQAADRACYAAKEAGRNRVHLYLDADHAIEVRKGEMQWATRIEQAIEDNQFVLFCQRIMPLDETTGCRGEILLRMKDSKGELIQPSAFLPAAERFHMASRIDRWVLKEVFEWMRTHADSLKHIDSLSVNLSGQSIGDSTFHQYVLELIQNTPIDCNKLCFEITETSAITNLALATRFIDAMRKHNIRFSLDDFGSGVSSFGYLKNLSVDYLKIDGQFIRDIANDPIDQATVRCISEVARVTGKKTIAEWVEDEPAEIMLKNIQIDFSQGYLRHRPAPLMHMLDVKCTYKSRELH